MKLIIADKVKVIAGTPEEVFRKLAKRCKLPEDHPFTLLNYCDILHTLCYPSKPKYGHIDQVYAYALVLNEIYAKCRFSAEILKTAAVYHDIAKQFDDEHHGELAKETIINDIVVQNFLTPGIVADIAKAVQYHSYKSAPKEKRDNMLSKIIYDADSIRCISEFKPKERTREYFNEYIESLYFGLSKDMMSYMFNNIKEEK